MMKKIWQNLLRHDYFTFHTHQQFSFRELGLITTLYVLSYFWLSITNETIVWIFVTGGDIFLMSASLALYRQVRRVDITARPLFVASIFMFVWHLLTVITAILAATNLPGSLVYSVYAIRGLAAMGVNLALLCCVGFVINEYRKNLSIVQVMIDSAAIICLISLVFGNFTLLGWSQTWVNFEHPIILVNLCLNLLVIASCFVWWRLISSSRRYQPKAIVFWQKTMIIALLAFFTTDFINEHFISVVGNPIDFTLAWQLSLGVLVLAVYKHAQVNPPVYQIHADTLESLATQMKTIRYIHLLTLVAIVLCQFQFIYTILILAVTVIHYIITKYVHIFRERQQLLHEYTQMNEHLESEVEKRTAQLLEKNRELEQIAKYDHLTGLANSRYLQAYCQELMSGEREFTLLLLDLDHFKAVNDWYGHDVGDELLIAIATRVQTFLTFESCFARQGGDEFIIVIPHREGLCMQTQLDTFIQIFEHPFALSHQTIEATFSVGVAHFPKQAQTYQELVKCADLALYHSKNVGRNCWTLYDDAYRRKLTLEYDLKHVDFSREFELYYQPEFEAKTGKLIGCEALVRWHHREFGLVPPNEFITIAEETAQINRLGDWVLETACAQIAAWNHHRGTNLFMAVNLSTKQLYQADFATRVQAVLAKYAVKTAWLELEIVETHRVSESPTSIIQLKKLSDIGIRLAIDDFGTGYSSISYLNLFPVHKLKIARELVYQMTSESLDTKIVAGLVKLADSINVTTIAEGVETREQLELLRELGCEQIQGYYYSRPIPAHEFTKQYLN